MKLDKTNVCVFIESEAHLQQARELLKRYGEKESKYDDAFVFEQGKYPYLILNKSCDWWYLDNTTYGNEVLNVSELEEILKGEKDA